MGKGINALHFESDMMVSADELTPDLERDLRDCGAPGDAQQAVDYVISVYSITGDPTVCRGILSQYGAWEDDELLDHDTNLQRLVWLAGCDLEESDELYFANY
jgi:hypothetical protein